MAESVIRIAGVHPTIDGDYPIDLGGFSNRDFHDIKRIANVRSQELQEAFAKGDTDMFVAFAVIALRHAGKPVSEDVLWDAPVASLVLVVGDEEEAEELPPASPLPSVIENEPGGGGEPRSESETSGFGSRSDADEPAIDQNGTGTPHSDIGATSPLEMSAT